MTTEQALNIIARCGRASLSFHTGKLGVVVDYDALPVSYVYGPSNIIQDSFEISYVSKELADQITVEFYNAANDYKLDQVRVNVPRC